MENVKIPMYFVKFDADYEIEGRLFRQDSEYPVYRLAHGVSLCGENGSLNFTLGLWERTVKAWKLAVVSHK